MNQLIALVKECLSIISTATAKDNEISLLINSEVFLPYNLNNNIALDVTSIVEYGKL